MYKVSFVYILFTIIIGCSHTNSNNNITNIDLSDNIIQCKYIFYNEIKKDKSLKIDIENASLFFSKSNDILDLNSTRLSASSSALLALHNLFSVKNQNITIRKIFMPDINFIHNFLNEKISLFVKKENFKKEIIYKKNSTTIYKISSLDQIYYIYCNIKEFGLTENKDNNIYKIISPKINLTNRYDGVFEFYIGTELDNHNVKNPIPLNNAIRLKLLKIVSQEGYISFLYYGKFNIIAFKGNIYTFKDIKLFDLKEINL